MTWEKVEIASELEGLPPEVSEEVLRFIRFLKSQCRRAVPGTALASEPVLWNDWLRPEEEEAWSDL